MVYNHNRANDLICVLAIGFPSFYHYVDLSFCQRDIDNKRTGYYNINVKKLALIILDGWGLGRHKENNAIDVARTPFFDYLWKKFPHTRLQASGIFVGLPEGQIGGSEVGHLTIGAGRIIRQTLPRINQGLASARQKDGILDIAAFKQFLKNAQRKTPHLIQLISAGGIHSHIDHLFAILKLMKTASCKSPIIHYISDGRDRPPQSGINDAKHLLQLINKLKYGKVVTLSGRFYAMDRDNNWERTARAAQNIVCPPVKKSHRPALSLTDHFRQAYDRKTGDEFIEPVLIDRHFSGVGSGEPLFFLNFRADRMKQLVAHIRRLLPLSPIFTMTRYDMTYDFPVIFEKEIPEQTLGKIISRQSARQLRAAETEKAPHVSYFFNGGAETVFTDEHRVFAESNKVKHDLAPEMKLKEIGLNVTTMVKKISPQFILINFANSDMVGHTGNFPAIVAAVEKTDRQLEKTCRFLTQQGYACVITADHGNADIAFDLKTHEPHTAHTLNPVPFIVYDPHRPQPIKLKCHSSLGLGEVGGTVLDLMEIEKPKKGFVSLILK